MTESKRTPSLARPEASTPRAALDRLQAEMLPEPTQVTFERLVEPIRDSLDEAKRVYASSLLSVGRSVVSEETLARRQSREACGPDLIAAMADYVLQLEGKWLRPALLLFAAEQFGKSGANAPVIAAAMELIHNATLIHDDLIDEAETRRGRQTVWRRWGASASVLMGDLLFAKAFELTSTHGDPALQRVIAGATTRMCQGELHQLQSACDVEVTEVEYLQVVGDKTACFMSACTECGALIAGARPEASALLRQYGFDFGMAFQITDDVLDYVADAQELGKSIGNDFQRGKITLPLIHFLATSSAPEPVQAWLSSQGSGKSVDLQAALRETGSIDYSLGIARRYTEQAKSRLDALAALGVPQARLEHLRGLADFVVTRRF